MKTVVILLIGAVVGALDGVGIFFAPGEPYKFEILFAAILKGMLVSLTTGFSLNAHSSWLQAQVTECSTGSPSPSSFFSRKAVSNPWTPPMWFHPGSSWV